MRGTNKPRGVEGKLKRLKALRSESATAGLIEELRKFLKDESSLVVAEAAEFAGDKQLTDLAADLESAFERFMIDPIESDKGCRAKFAAVTALHKMDYDRPDVFLHGLKHVQEEWRWGQPEPEDTAADLRGQSAFALVRLNYPGVLLLLSDLLADKQRQARAAAAQALAALGHPAGIPLLRFKLRIADAEPDVMQECFTALIKLDAVDSVPLVASYLAKPRFQEAAALALGESRHPAALPPLTKFADAPGPHQEVALLALSLSRLQAAIDYLVDLLSTKSAATLAALALAALAIHRHNPTLRARIASKVGEIGDKSLLERFRKKFEME